MKPTDKKLLQREDLESGFVYERVINGGGTNYSIILDPSKFEIMSNVTTFDHNGRDNLLNYWDTVKDMYIRDFKSDARNVKEGR